MEDHMVLVVPASHEWADNEINVSMLKDAPLLMREFGSGSRRVVENALTQAGIKKKELNTTMELDSTEGLLSAVEAGLGVTFVSRWAVRNQLALGTLKLAPGAWCQIVPYVLHRLSRWPRTCRKCRSLSHVSSQKRHRPHAASHRESGNRCPLCRGTYEERSESQEIALRNYTLNLNPETEEPPGTLRLQARRGHVHNSPERAGI
jgi:hypothetical protein